MVINILILVKYIKSKILKLQKYFVINPSHPGGTWFALTKKKAIRWTPNITMLIKISTKNSTKTAPDVVVFIDNTSRITNHFCKQISLLNIEDRMLNYIQLSIKYLNNLESHSDYVTLLMRILCDAYLISKLVLNCTCWDVIFILRSVVIAIFYRIFIQITIS